MRYLPQIILALFLAGCGGGGSSSSGSFKPINSSYELKEKNSYVTLKNIKDATLTLDLGPNPKSLYVVTTSHFNNQTIFVNSLRANKRVDREIQKSTPKSKAIKESLAKRVLEFRENTFRLLRIPDHNQISTVQKSKRVSARGIANRFCVDMDSSYNCKRYINATAVRLKSNIETTQGQKSLVIWLEDGISIKSSALNNLSDIFLKEGLDNDIYDWESNIFSSEWGADAKDIDSHLIGYDGTINILVYNMHSANLAGFFWPKDNFTKSYIAASNEKIMFYINAQLLNSDQKETFTTLNHEFQHMIHFYQRAVRKDIHDDTWFNEMMSEAIEDLLATKIGYYGPRNVNPNDGSAGASNNKKGRYPSFNANNTLSLTSWGDNIAHYGKVSAFGAYLNRNYGGAALLHKLMISDKEGAKALKEATKESLTTLINQWGSAVILSDQVGIGGKLQFNKGAFFENGYGNSIYTLGSINFFNYNPNPKFLTNATLDSNANLYTKVGKELSGKIELKIDIPKGATVTLIAK